MAKGQEEAVVEKQPRDPFVELWEFKKIARQFCNEMVTKFGAKQKAGYKGWDDLTNEELAEALKGMLKNNLKRGDWVDVGGLAAILWGRARKGK